ncbi:SpoIIE family protein phosphatase [Streptomyces sp. V3I7]|uniref:SpoIIE family protein phosphatase n=1 Tax=Streptomyces sp. V3I7 TaxID=3042278 RepID=UPI002780DB6C|nr:SpoIIE family protein phosphatase [Streptomyces sp. V3I7]MDQ0989059.1 PAS domain S-box-containing protein [Streptomyces sp. V3I7]
MPSHLSADRPAAQPPGRGSVEALITQTRRLRGDVDAVRRDSRNDGSDPRDRWQRALYDLALHQLDDLDEHLSQLRDGPPPASPAPEPQPGEPEADPSGSLLSRVGSAEWNLMTDGASWSEELYQILGRSPATPALTLDELPSLVHDDDRPKLTAMVTDCLVDARPIDGEFRVLLPDGAVRTVHMMGEPVLDADGSTTSMWAVVRDVSELHRSRRTVRDSHDSLQRHRRHTGAPDAVPSPRRGSLRLPHREPRPLELAVHQTPDGDGWCDTLDLPGGDTLLSTGDLTGPGGTGMTGRAMLLGALRGMAMAGTEPGQLLAWLDQLLAADSTHAPPSLAGALCCRYRPADRILAWARRGRPAPLLFRDGTGRLLDAPDSTLLGPAALTAGHGQAEVALEPGDVLLLLTGGLVPERGVMERITDLASRFATAPTAQDCLRAVVEEFGGIECEDRADGACVLVARVNA